MVEVVCSGWVLSMVEGGLLIQTLLGSSGALGSAAVEPLGVRGVGGVQDVLASRAGLFPGAVMNRGWRV